ncbi:hypothetical protein [uncultured Roseovarius sp.]|uniref:hypothetical protein n=1 Tax=uncultured Roseovarius sp. TaxID=293344 RepID=UPI0026292C55|nr:hypothetical protein [uncultured Roseovarius sp.]
MSTLRKSVNSFLIYLIILLPALWVYSDRDVYAELSIECSVSWEFSGQKIDFATNDEIWCTDRELIRTTWLGDTPFQFLTTSEEKDVRLPAHEFVAHVYGKDGIYDDAFLEKCFSLMQTNIKNVVGENLAFWQSLGHAEFPGMECQKSKLMS